MLQSHEKKLIYLTLSILASLLLVGGLIIYPQFRAIQKMNQQIFEMRQDLETKYERSRYLHRSQHFLVSAKQLVRDLQELFLKNGAEIDFISFLEELAEKNSLEQKLTISPPVKETGDEFSRINLRVTARGDFKNLMNYLSALERGRFLATNSEIRFSGDQTSSPSLFLKLTIYAQD